MFPKKLNWHRLAENPESLNWQDNSIAVTEVNGKKICIAKYREQFFAFAYTCPHASGIMADGWIDLLGNVVCPLHRYKFNIINGRNTSGEGYYLKTYPLRIDEKGIFVEL
jgi:3-phenylpropionate/trans-cinnamate dioxygenase ferredoxin subunit